MCCGFLPAEVHVEVDEGLEKLIPTLEWLECIHQVDPGKNIALDSDKCLPEKAESPTCYFVVSLSHLDVRLIWSYSLRCTSVVPA